MNPEAFVRPAFAALSTLAPGLAGRAAFHLFATPYGARRPVASGSETVSRAQATLAAAMPRRVRHPAGEVMTWRWRPDPEETPSRGRVLLVHGWQSRALYMTAFVAPLLAAGFDVTALDLPAHGESSGRIMTLPIAAEALVAVGEETGPFDAVVSHSFGGPVSLLAIEGGAPLSRGMPAKRLVFVAPPNSMALATRDFAARIGLTARGLKALEDRIHAVAGRPVEAFVASDFLAQARIPSLVVHDQDDIEVPFENGLAMASAGSFVQFHPTTGLGHRRVLFAPQVVAAATDFLRRMSDADVPGQRTGSTETAAA